MELFLHSLGCRNHYRITINQEIKMTNQIIKVFVSAAALSRFGSISNNIKELLNNTICLAGHRTSGKHVHSDTQRKIMCQLFIL